MCKGSPDLMDSTTWAHSSTLDMYTWVHQLHLMYKLTSIGTNCPPEFTKYFSKVSSFLAASP